MYPGQFPTLRRNCFNVIAALDLSHTSSISFIAQIANNLISRSLPFRFGYVPLIETAESRQVARLMKWMMDEYGFEKTAQYFSVVGPLFLFSFQVVSYLTSLIGAQPLGYCRLETS
jgi:UDP-glucose:glycoprotein glucosyltransferase